MAFFIVSGVDVGQVDGHAQSIHLFDDLDAERAQPAGRGVLVPFRIFIQSGVGPAGPPIGGEREVAAAEPVVHPEGS